MKFSIKSIFKNLLFFLTLSSSLLFVISLIEVNRYASFNKIKSIKEQKLLVNKMYDLGRNDIDYSIIQVRGMSAELKTEALSLNTISSYDFLWNILGMNGDFEKDTNKLLVLEDEYIAKLSAYYENNTNQLDRKLQELTASKQAVLNLLNEMIFKNVDYDYRKFSITQWLIYLTFLNSLIASFWYYKKLKIIYNDIKSLFAVGHEKTSETAATKEIDAIQLRMVRKPTTTQNPSMVDPVTGIKNYKGMIHAYSEKKGMKDSNYTTVCVFEVDNFKKYDKELPKELSQSILKKISFIMSLYEQPTDVIARIDFDQFAVILSRDSKEKALNDCESIRKSIEEAVFKDPKGAKIPFTLSGGFVIKQSNRSLEDTISHAKEVLQTAKTNGYNRIAQIRDHAEKF
ncbi:GGDEF domain-containing protein [Sulfurimonas sp. HSL-1716]|uniref:GGDEF domain-containing protein n=1 Tax=Hydrocurvibacter sulfurireducens TaxID=3131937 RepID=UPI0031F82F3A